MWLHFMDLIQQLADDVAFQHADFFAADEEQGFVLAACYADVGIGGFAGAIDDTAAF